MCLKLLGSPRRLLSGQQGCRYKVKSTFCVRELSVWGKHQPVVPSTLAPEEQQQCLKKKIVSQSPDNISPSEIPKTN